MEYARRTKMVKRPIRRELWSVWFTFRPKVLLYALRGHSERGRTNSEKPYSGIFGISVSVQYRYRTRSITIFGIAYRYRISGIFSSIRYRYPPLVCCGVFWSEILASTVNAVVRWVNHDACLPWLTVAYPMVISMKYPWTTPSVLLWSAFKSSHARGAANVSELLTWRGQYLTRNMTSTKFVRATRQTSLCASTRTIILENIMLNYHIVPHVRSSTAHKKMSQGVQSLPWDDSSVDCCTDGSTWVGPCTWQWGVQVKSCWRS